MKSVKIVIKERTNNIVQGTLYVDAEGAGKYSDVGPVWLSTDECDIVVDMLQYGCSEDTQFVLEDSTEIEDEY